MEWMQYGNRAIRALLEVQGVKSEVADLPGATVHFYRAQGRGSGPPLLLVHGLGSSANAFFRTLPAFAKRFSQVFAIDLPGNGFSPVPSNGPPSLRPTVDLLLEFRRRVIGERVFLVGNSLGGGMALYAAGQDPGALRALGLVAPAGARLSEERWASLLQSFRVTSPKEARALAHKLFAKPPLPLLLLADELRKMVSTETVQRIVAEVSPADAIAPEALRALAMPTLLIWGQREKLLPYEAIDYFRAHLPPHAEVHEVRGFGHMPQLEHPREFVRRITDFAVAHQLV
ncbi:MAG: alpha/beta fold hydrolase [Myxococcota bacterium]|jgi:pimeloyl-ACP methyl ester carboxylesterase